MDLYRHEIERANVIIASTPKRTSWPRPRAGQLDAARELIDGRQWRVVT
jgi:hypothetical protein